MGKVVSDIGAALGSAVTAFGEILGLTPETKVPERSYNQDLLTNETAPTSHIGVVYGTRRKAGVRIATIVKGDNREYLYAIYALSHGPIQEISNPRMGDRSLSISANWFDINYGLGGLDQDATQLPLVAELGTDWDQVNGKLGGCAFAIIKLEATEHTPKFGNVTFDVKGRLVFDPRKPLDPPKWSDNPALCILDYQTNDIYGKGTLYPQGFNVQSYIDAADHFETIVGTETPESTNLTRYTEINRHQGAIEVDVITYYKLIAGRTYQVTGFSDPSENFSGVLTSKVVIVPRFVDPTNPDESEDETYLLFFEEVHDTERTLIAPSDGVVLTFSGISTRYTCNGNVDTSQTVYDNLVALNTSFNGNVSFFNGVSTIIPDKVTPPTAHFDGSNITSDITVNLPNSSTQLNEITGTWFDPEFGYEQMTEVVKSEVFLKRDAGRVQPKEVNLPFCNDPTLLNRILTVELNKSRHGGAIHFSTLWDGLDVVVGQVITVSDTELKWNARTLLVIRILVPDIYNDVGLVCLPYESDDYLEGVPNLRRVSEYIDYGSPVDITLPTELTAIRGVTYDEPVSVSWKPSAVQLYDYFRLEVYQISRDNGGVITDYTLVDKVNHIYTTSYLSGYPMTVGAEYQFRLYLITPYGVTSGSYVSTNYTHKKLQHPSDIKVTTPSPWSIIAEPLYSQMYSEQSRLDHNWYVAECELDIPDPEDPETFTVIEADFSDAELVATSRVLNWNGARPDKHYRVWCQAVTSFDESYTIMGGYNNSVPPLWVISNGKPAYVPDTVPEDFGSAGGALTLRLAADHQVFHEGIDNVITPDFITFVAHQNNFDSPVAWVTDPVEAVLTGEGLTRTLPKDQLAEFSSVKVTVTSDDLSDTLTIVRLKDGSQGITAFLTNESHVISAESDGTVTGNLLAAGGEFKVYLGGEDVTADCTFSKVSQDGLTCSISDLEVNKGVYTITEVVDDSGTAIFRAEYGATIIEQSYSISKSKTGRGGITGFLTNSAHVLPSDTDGLVTSYLGADGEFKVFQDDVNLTEDYEFAKFSGAGLDWENDDKVTINATTGEYIVAGDQALPDGKDAGYVTFSASREGYQTLYATFSVSKSKQGSQGGSIQDIVDIINGIWDSTDNAVEIVSVSAEQAQAALVLEANTNELGVVSARAFLGTIVGESGAERVTGIYVEDQDDPENPELKGTIEFSTDTLILTDSEGVTRLSWDSETDTWVFTGAIKAGSGSEIDGAYIKQLTVGSIAIENGAIGTPKIGDQAVSIPWSVEFGSLVTSGNGLGTFPLVNIGEYVGGGIMFNFAINGIRTSASSSNDEYADIYVKAYLADGDVLQKTFTYKMGLPIQNMPNTTTCCGVFDDSVLSDIIGGSVYVTVSIHPWRLGNGDNVTFSGVGYIQYAKK